MTFMKTNTQLYRMIIMIDWLKQRMLYFRSNWYTLFRLECSFPLQRIQYLILAYSLQVNTFVFLIMKVYNYGILPILNFQKLRFTGTFFNRNLKWISHFRLNWISKSFSSEFDFFAIYFQKETFKTLFQNIFFFYLFFIK